MPSSANGGSGSRTSSPGCSPKTVGTFDLDGVPVAWDNEPSIRERIRGNKNLCLAYDETGEPACGKVDASLENVKLNSAVLKPILVIMASYNLQLPSIEVLISAVEHFFALSKLSRSMDACYQEAWAIRRMIGKAKKMTYRSFPPQDHLCIVHIQSQPCCLFKSVFPSKTSKQGSSSQSRYPVRSFHESHGG